MSSKTRALFLAALMIVSVSGGIGVAVADHTSNGCHTASGWSYGNGPCRNGHTNDTGPGSLTLLGENVNNEEASGSVGVGDQYIYYNGSHLKSMDIATLSMNWSVSLDIANAHRSVLYSDGIVYVVGSDAENSGNLSVDAVNISTQSVVYQNTTNVPDQYSGNAFYKNGHVIVSDSNITALNVSGSSADVVWKKNPVNKTSSLSGVGVWKNAVYSYNTTIDKVVAWDIETGERVLTAPTLAKENPSPSSGLDQPKMMFANGVGVRAMGPNVSAFDAQTGDPLWNITNSSFKTHAGQLTSDGEYLYVVEPESINKYHLENGTKVDSWTMTTSYPDSTTIIFATLDANDNLYVAQGAAGGGSALYKLSSGSLSENTADVPGYLGKGSMGAHDGTLVLSGYDGTNDLLRSFGAVDGNGTDPAYTEPFTGYAVGESADSGTDGGTDNTTSTPTPTPVAPGGGSVNTLFGLPVFLGSFMGVPYWMSGLVLALALTGGVYYYRRELATTSQYN